MNHNFREVIIDQQLAAKWTDIDMNLGGGPGTSPGPKYSDKAGGFSYTLFPDVPILRNRFIYWRILNDMLELTESSMDYNLDDNQIRIIFRGSPIIGNISIHETETQIVILVPTLVSVNRFIFEHPAKLNAENPKGLKCKVPSIFRETVMSQAMDFKTFGLFEHTTHIPIPISGASSLVDDNYVFAMSYESGSVTLCRINANGEFTVYDLRQSNLFSRIMSFTPNILKSQPTAVPDAVVALDFFNCKRKGKKALHLVTITQNGHIRLYYCNNLDSFGDWNLADDKVIHNYFILNPSATLDLLLLRRAADKGKSNELPSFVIYLAGQGFSFFQVVRNPEIQQIGLLMRKSVEFHQRIVTDFCLTPTHLFVLLSNPDEETKWEIQSYELRLTQPTFHQAYLDPPPLADEAFDHELAEPKEYFSDLIFNKNSFNVYSIYCALNMFPNAANIPKSENDWELTKFYAMRVLESEVRNATHESLDEDEVMDDNEILSLNTKNWLEFYNSCVEYHLTTIKPLGLFYESNTKLPCIIKKSRLSFLRSMDFLETLSYLPNSLRTELSSEEDTSDQDALCQVCTILDLIETNLVDEWKQKIDRYLRESRGLQLVTLAVDHVAGMVVNADPQCELTRNFADVIVTHITELEPGVAEAGVRALLHLMCCWEGEEGYLNSLLSVDTVERPVVTENFMGSRLGINLGYNISKQLFAQRYKLIRNTLVFVAMAKVVSTSNNMFNIHVHEDRELQSIFVNLYNFNRLFERSAEFVPENWHENGLKISNLLHCTKGREQGVQQIHTKLSELWPIRLMELFAAGTGLAIRSRMEQYKDSLPVSYADAFGRALWPARDSKEFPFLDFLVSACQYNGLSQYVTTLHDSVFPASAEIIVRHKFFNGIADLFIQTPQCGLARFLSISPQQLVDAPLFSQRYLGIIVQTPSQTTFFYEKAISICQVLQYKNGIQLLAQKAINATDNELCIRKMAVLGFKSALSVQDYENAFFFIGKMSGRNCNDVMDRDSSIRTVVTDLLEKREIDFLLSIPFHYYGQKDQGYREQVEKVLSSQAKLSDPLQQDGIYQMVYLYHICQRDYLQAGYSLLERIVQIGVKGRGKPSLELQRDSYLDILQCITLAEGFGEMEEEDQDEIPDYGGSGDAGWTSFIMDDDEEEKKKKVPSRLFEQEGDPVLLEKLGSYEAVKKETELCIALLTLHNDRELEPIKYKDELRRAVQCVDSLVQVHRYPQALSICSVWDLPIEPVIEEVAKTCVKVTYDIKPASGDSSDYAKHIDSFEVGSGNLPVQDMVFLALKNYISKYEKPVESILHKTATLTFLKHRINLPRWLYDSYKKRNVSQLLWCFIQYGDWEDATTLAISIFDATLGIRNSDDFDPTIQKISQLEPIPYIPFEVLDALYNELVARVEDGEKNLKPYLEKLETKAEDFRVQVIDTRDARQTLYRDCDY